MYTFVKGENEMWKMPAKKRIQTRIVSASAVKRVLDLLMFRKLCSDKKETPVNYYAAILLFTEMWQNISGENLRLLNSKINIWINIGYICECTLSAMSRVK